MEITKLYAFHFTSGPDGELTVRWRALQKKTRKQMVTIPDRIVKVST